MPKIAIDRTGTNPAAFRRRVSVQLRTFQSGNLKPPEKEYLPDYDHCSRHGYHEACSPLHCSR